MGRKEIVPYALYRLHGYINPFLAPQTGFNDEDSELLFNGLVQMFEHDRSASRGEMSDCRLIAFKHESALGNAPARKLFDLIDVKLKEEAELARSFDDYEVAVDDANLPKGINVENRL